MIRWAIPALGGSLSVQAQDFPSRQVSIVAPFLAGSLSDAVAFAWS